MRSIYSDTTNISKGSKPDHTGSMFLPEAIWGTKDTVGSLNDTSITLVNSIKTPKTSLLNQHTLQLQNQQPIQRNLLNTDWISGLLILCFILLAFARAFYNKRLQQFFKSFFSSRFQHMMQRDRHIFKDRVSIPLFIIYCISFSLFVHQSIIYFFPGYDFPVDNISLFLLIIFSVLLLSLLKILIILIYGMVFKSNYIRSEIIVTNFVFNVVFGILLLPILIINIFLPSPFFLYLGFFLWLSSLLYKGLRQIFTRIPDTKFSLFNRFIYLCTFEITPVLVLIKLVLNELQ